MSIAIVGDLHIREVSPTSRVDNYFQACLNKLERLLAIHNHVIVLGDFFHKPTMGIEHLNLLATFLSNYKGRVHSILGNHDAYYRTLNLDKTSIGLLNNVGLINLHLDTFKLEGYSFDVCSVVPELKLPTKKSDILLGHFYFEDELKKKESLFYEDVKDYKLVFAGHEHSPKGDFKVGDTTVIRNGCLGREDCSKYNTERDSIRYSVIDDGSLITKYLDVVPAKDVFTPQSIDNPILERKDTCYDLDKLDKMLGMFKTDKKESSLSTEKVLVQLETPEVCLTYLKTTHECLGIKF